MEPGPFSAFPGVQRTITIIEGSGLELDFGAHVAKLEPRLPFTFDSGLTPDGRPVDGPVRVLNVMASLAVWRIEPASVLSEPAELDAALSVVFAIGGSCLVSAGTDHITLRAGDTALVETPGRVAPQLSRSALVVPLMPV